MSDQGEEGFTIKGWHVWGVFILFFGVIASVNIYMATQAIGTFSGLEVKNSYVASQEFDEKREAQEALGWSVEPQLFSDRFEVKITDAYGNVAPLSDLSGMIGRTTVRTQDQDLVFERTALGVHVAPIEEISGGRWEIRLYATSLNGVAFEQRRIMTIEGEGDAALPAAQ
ncbi:MAG: nitrogen fixation protein FixH [Rhodobacterales bacterium]|nr:MAG: nitrogen fixation protein FixH [Rhodobacterales bacterium]